MAKKLFALLVLLVFLITPFVFPQNNLNIIPKPLKTELLQENFSLNNKTTILISSNSTELKKLAEFLNDAIKNSTGFELKIHPFNKQHSKNSILFQIVYGRHLGKEGYLMSVHKNIIKISANTEAGLFYGVQTLLQLLPAEILSNQVIKSKEWNIPCVSIKDKPEFKYRGMHLDVSRHFFPKEFIKKYIDLLAAYKLNYFHWHLTDDNGWRIEIKKYPLLTKISAWHVDREDEPWNNWSPVKPGESATYGGFYTQEDIREIVKYAAERYITIIPEIEMPAHSSEVFAAYPQYSCKGDTLNVVPGTYWPNTDILCAGNDSTFTFLEDILSEVFELFPGPYIHIGGDEANKSNWENCPKCRARMKAEGLNNEKELQSYFIKRIGNFISSKGKIMIGWDEILEGGLADDAVVMSWRGMAGGIEAARQKHDVIMTPTDFCYFDYYQADPQYEPKAIGGFVTLKKVYSFNPYPEELSSDERNFILGGQANLWSEFIKTPEHAEYMLLPRMLALAEDVWTPAKGKNWNDFIRRVNEHYKRFDKAGLNYSRGSYKINFEPKFNDSLIIYNVKLNTEQYNPEIHYTIDGNTPDKNSSLYSQPITISGSSSIKAAIFENGEQMRGISEQDILFHNGMGKKIYYVNEPAEKYSGNGKTTLLDGIKGSLTFSDGYWQGIEGKDFDVIIDLEKVMPLNEISFEFLQNISSWIFFPKEVSFTFSNDGVYYTDPFIVRNDVSDKTENPLKKKFSFFPANKSARFIHIKAINIGPIPVWHPGAGGEAWLFADEIIIN